MPRKILILKYFFPSVIALLFFSAVAYYLFFQPRPISETTLETVVQTINSGLRSRHAGTLSVRLFYRSPLPTRNGQGLLIEEDKLISQIAQPEKQALLALKELSRTSPAGNAPALPTDALPLHVFFTDNELAIVDYDKKIRENLAGGLDAELAAMYAVVHTITYNFPKVSSVRLLVEGKEQETLAGHFSISGNLKPNPAMIQGYQNASGGIRVEPLPP